MKGVKDQSIGILAIAFAILISTIIEATTNKIVPGQGLTSYHAAVILDLSWMNNTSTWIWFLLYAHSLTKSNEGKDSEKKPIPAAWSNWTIVLLSPLRYLVTGRDLDKKPNTEEDAPASEKLARKQKPGAQYCPQTLLVVVQRVWHLVSQKPVLTLGSLHLSLMSAIGLWLWSNPSKFGTPIHCTPTLTVVGSSVPFSSQGLHGFSLAMYSLLLIPGFNLVPPFLFFLALHITYNKFRQHAFQACKSIWHRETLHDPESGTDAPPPIQVDDSDQAPPAANHTAFLIVGLVCLVAINIILLVDVEVTIAHNNHGQSQEENEWGFGQVLALLLLVVPLRDFVTSILEIQKAFRSGEKARDKAQHAFNKHLSEAIVQDTFDNHDFKILIDQDANANVKLMGM
jgi:hypothetical protein